MRPATRSIITLAASLAAATVVQAAGSVTVAYVQPDKFTDAGNSLRDVDGNLKQLTRHLEALASRHLADGQSLAVEVLDIDLAGAVRRPGRIAEDIRVLKGAADWPRIKLRFTLQAAGQPARSGEQMLADMAYLQRGLSYAARDPLRYEKRLLDEWFAAQFGAPGAR